VTGVRRAIDLRSALDPGAAELGELFRELLDGADPAKWLQSLRPIKPPRVYRVEFTAGAPWRSIVLKRLQPAVGERDRLVAERWLPALGLGDRCARLLGVAAERRGRCVWHLYEDLGDETLATRPDPEHVAAAVDLTAELHTRAARHPVLADVRRYDGGRGIPYFTTNIRDALAALDTLRASRIEPPPECSGLPARLRERLRGLLADVPRRAKVFDDAAGPDTLLHGDLWTINTFVADTPDGLRARFVDWDQTAVGPFSYDLSTFLFRFPPEQRRWILARYRQAVAPAGWSLPSASELDVLFDTAERARYANRVIWPALALVQGGADWGFPELAEIERWFIALDAASPAVPVPA
jgi:phosphotransferase family enzyme